MHQWCISWFCYAWKSPVQISNLVSAIDFLSDAFRQFTRAEEKDHPFFSLSLDAWMFMSVASLCILLNGGASLSHTRRRNESRAVLFKQVICLSHFSDYPNRRRQLSSPGPIYIHFMLRLTFFLGDKLYPVQTKGIEQLRKINHSMARERGKKCLINVTVHVH